MTVPEQPSAESGPPLTVAAVARRLGVAPATLRTWDRRYGLGPSDHSAGDHRRYSPSDLRMLELMRELTVMGVTPAEAARAAKSGAIGGHGVAKGGGGRVVAMPGVEPEVRGLARAAMALDAPASRRIVADHFTRAGICWTWDNLIQPVLVGIGERWESTQSCVDVEHVLSGVVSATLREKQTDYPEPTNKRPVLLAAAAEEQHTLPIEVLSVALAERGVDTRLMGARVPSSALGDAVRRSGACAVFVWAHEPDVICPHQWTKIPETRPKTARVVGGPGMG